VTRFTVSPTIKTTTTAPETATATQNKCTLARAKIAGVSASKSHQSRDLCSPSLRAPGSPGLLGGEFVAVLVLAVLTSMLPTETLRVDP